MTEDEAARKLQDMYQNAPDGEMATNIHLFGIKYADELAGLDLKAIAERATGGRSYDTEIPKGIRLARYVDLRC